MNLQQYYSTYLASRTSNYEFRCIRYHAVYKELMKLGLDLGHVLIDVGAGRCDFFTFLIEQGWYGHYVPIDAVIDGTDLNTWHPKGRAHFLVAIEVVEHVHNPHRLYTEMAMSALKGAVITTPNPLTTDVLGMDYTHVSMVYPHELEQRGWRVRTDLLFLHHPEDTIIASISA